MENYNDCNLLLTLFRNTALVNCKENKSKFLPSTKICILFLLETSKRVDRRYAS